MTFHRMLGDGGAGAGPGEASAGKVRGTKYFPGFWSQWSPPNWALSLALPAATSYHGHSRRQALRIYANDNQTTPRLWSCVDSSSWGPERTLAAYLGAAVTGYQHHCPDCQFISRDDRDTTRHYCRYSRVHYRLQADARSRFSAEFRYPSTENIYCTTNGEN